MGTRTLEGRIEGVTGGKGLFGLVRRVPGVPHRYGRGDSKTSTRRDPVDGGGGGPLRRCKVPSKYPSKTNPPLQRQTKVSTQERGSRDRPDW